MILSSNVMYFSSVMCPQLISPSRLSVAVTALPASLIVFDEVDAHVGGQAAVAVAKLLRRLGSRRQIVAVTHNPVIAAAAHEHWVVARSSSHPERSSLRELRAGERQGQGHGHGQGQGLRTCERERELGRMVTGDLRTTAGLNLARALLEQDFE